mmetsp:Transcript_23594/g.76745  ORF Transcript_23594/g.76745 Transcript_23594/m.76745 type:complete len:205 (+) Transcript_23594:364-978(+)
MSSTSSRSCWLRLAFSQSAIPSENAPIIDPITMFTTSFIRAPAPTSPRKRLFLPITSRAGTTSLYSDSSPAHKKMSCPSMAGFFDPDTGASRKRPPLAVMASPIALDVAASTVETSTYALPAAMPSTTPPASNATFFATSGSASIANVMEHDLMTSAGVAACVAPAATASAHLSGVRFHTVTWFPALSRLSAMGVPMIPMPTKP